MSIDSVVPRGAGQDGGETRGRSVGGRWARLRPPGWAGFLAGRALNAIVIAFALVIATFLLVRLVPGDPARIVAGTHATTAQLEVVRHQIGLDRPLADQFWSYLGGVPQLHLGSSFQSGEPVSRIIAERLPKTAELAGAALGLTLLLSVIPGLAAAALTRDGRHRGFATVFVAVTGALSSLPVFLTGSVLAFLFAVELKWLPIAGSDSATSVILPALSVALMPAALMARLVRLEALDALGQEYVRTARSKRLPTLTIYRRHMLPNVVASTLTIAGVLFAQLIGGVVIVENIFAWPGLGTILVQSVVNHDYPVVQGVTLLLGLILVVTNTLVDVLLALLDPRSTLSRG
jgi:peptide/nickel transport system permease protein